jgi:hypothetical protein
MKKTYKTMLLAALIAHGLMAGVTAVQAQATYPTGELIIGFTVGSGNDTVYDLGQVSSLANGETWNLGFLLTGYGNFSSLSWGVIGSGQAIGSPRTNWTSTAVGVVPPPITGSSKFNAMINCVTTIYNNNFTNAGAGNWGVVPATASTSWNVETTPNATLSTDYINEYENPNVGGVNSLTLSQVINNGSTPTILGTFSLAANGVVTFSVPTSSPPVINSATLSGSGQFILTGTGGSANAQYRILATTDLTQPVASWIPVYTNNFLSTGSFAYTNNSPTNAASFFRIVTP